MAASRLVNEPSHPMHHLAFGAGWEAVYFWVSTGALLCVKQSARGLDEAPLPRYSYTVTIGHGLAGIPWHSGTGKPYYGRFNSRFFSFHRIGSDPSRRHPCIVARGGPGGRRTPSHSHAALQAGCIDMHAPYRHEDHGSPSAQST